MFVAAGQDEGETVRRAHQDMSSFTVLVPHPSLVSNLVSGYFIHASVRGAVSVAFRRDADAEAMCNTVHS